MVELVTSLNTSDSVTMAIGVSARRQVGSGRSRGRERQDLVSKVLVDLGFLLLLKNLAKASASAAG